MVIRERERAARPRRRVGHSAMGNPQAAVRRAFAERFGRRPEGVWAAPARVNLIGEHTDYNDGFVLPLAIDRRVTVAAARRADDLLRLVSLEKGEQRLRLAEVGPGAVRGWAAYAAGPLWALAQEGVQVGGLDLVLTSDVPIGSGLSSSAAVECATLLAARDLYGGPDDVARLASIAQRAENDVVGVPCGIMDQMAALACRAAHVLLLDCRSLEADQVPFAPADAGLALLVVDTRVSHALADGAYAERRAACEQATRVLEVATLLRRGRPDMVGDALSASHASLRDDYQVSAPELDATVEAAVAAGALGARMTGAGFGGCALALVPAGAVADVGKAVAATFADRGFREPAIFAAQPADGASRIA